MGSPLKIRGARGVMNESPGRLRSSCKDSGVVRGFSLVHDPEGSHYVKEGE